MTLYKNILTAMLSLLLATQALAAGPMCAVIYRDENNKTVAIVGSFKANPTVNEAAENIRLFKETVSGQILEREFVIEPFLAALIAKEHILLVGTPGNAKTTLAKILLSNIVDPKTGKAFYYSMQMNKEITLSDTHGSINYKTMSDKGVVERNYQEGVLGAKLAFIDESFDIRPGALRNLLDVLAERSHSQGTAHHKGLTELVIAATNKTLPEVYQDHNNTEAPRALIDRFAFTILVPKEMENIKSDRAIFRGDRAQAKPVHQISFADLDAVRSLMPKVTVPDYIADLAGLIHYRLAPEFEAREVKAMAQYREKVQNGEHALPPFRASKYMSPRTLGKAGNILKAFIVLDYIEKKGQRSLTATTEDLSKLRAFYQMGGPNDKFLDKQLARALKEEEKEQIKAVKTEREVANPVFDEVLKEFNESIAGFKLQEVDRMVRDYAVLPATEKHKVMDLLKLLYQKGAQASTEQDKDQLNSEMIASSAVVELVQGYVKMLHANKADEILKAWQKELGASSEKVLSPKQLRKLQYRYGYGEKKDVQSKVRGHKSANSRDLKNHLVRVIKGSIQGSGDVESFDLVGDNADRMMFFDQGAQMTSEDSSKGMATLLQWSSSYKKIIKVFPDQTYLVLQPDNNKVFAGFDRNWGPIGMIGKSNRIETDLEDKYRAYLWGSAGLYRSKRLQGSDGTLEKEEVENVLRTSLGHYGAADFSQTHNVYTSMVKIGGAQVQVIQHERKNGHFVLRVNQSFGFDTPEMKDDSFVKLVMLDAHHGLLQTTDDAGHWRLSLVHMEQKTIKLLATQIGGQDLSTSLDRKWIAVTEGNSIQVHSSASILKAASQGPSIGEPALSLKTDSTSGDSLKIGSFQSSRFSPDGEKLLVSGEDGFAVFSIPKK